jgi:hypothetical protein
MTARPQFSEYAGEAAYSIWEQGAGRVWAPDAVFPDVEGEANSGMDLAADLAGQEPQEHYQGWVIYDTETNEFCFPDDGSDGWAGGYNRGTGEYHDWSDGYESWAGGTTNWSGDFNNWISGYESWFDGYNSWAGGYATWAGEYDYWEGGFYSWTDGVKAWAGGVKAWAGGVKAWAGGYSAWAGGYSTWTDGVKAWAGSTGDPEWAEAFANQENVPSGTSSVGINYWVDDD